MKQITATYRLQLNTGYNFRHLRETVPYLKALGVSTLYLSPVFQAVHGSTHGYDITNPNRISPGLGTEEEVMALSRFLKENAIGWLQDIVPNHMAFHPENGWLADLFEKGPKSMFCSYFDTGFAGEFFPEPLLVPILAGHDPAQACSEKKIALEYSEKRFRIRYGSWHLPLNLASYVFVIRRLPDEASPLFTSLLVDLRYLEQVTVPEDFSAEWNQLLNRLAVLMHDEATAATVQNHLELLNSSPALLQEILALQYYRLEREETLSHQSSYRRFFTVGGLIGVRIHRPEVLFRHHQLVQSLVKSNVFQGLRIDHIDGILTPAVYLRHLRAMTGPDFYLVVEKILAPEEHLPADWPVAGTTGYDFLAAVNYLLTNPHSENLFTLFYRDLSGDTRPVEQVLHAKRAQILRQYMQGELANLVRCFRRLNLIPDDHPLAGDMLPVVLGLFLVHFPYYRTYFPDTAAAQQAAPLLQRTFRSILQAHPELSAPVDALREMLLEPPEHAPASDKTPVATFLNRCMQVCTTLAAKGQEDTLFYTYCRFLSHNEVGCSPAVFGLTANDFHQQMQYRNRKWPRTLNCTATHDTKRGEDSRALLNVLSEIPDEWFAVVNEWRSLNRTHAMEAGIEPAVEYFIYQALLGAFPWEENPSLEPFRERFGSYLQKAMREAKTHTGWEHPNTAYETAVLRFTDGLLLPGSAFFGSFLRFHTRLADHGILNALAQVVLKFTCPGIPDVYQGTELWDLSLVDPDNRRPVDFSLRHRLLEELAEPESGPAAAAGLWQQRRNGAIKLWLLRKLFLLRKRRADVFAKAAYVPLEVEGKYKAHVLAYARICVDTLIVALVPLHTALMKAHGGNLFPEWDWADTAVRLPPGPYAAAVNTLTGEQFAATPHRLHVSEVFRQLPAAVLEIDRFRSRREAGVLLHITSLPSAYGIGDLGSGAYRFADFLGRSRQKLWQLLPVTPVSRSQAFSPYSSDSSSAGNPFLISPELLYRQGLLTTAETETFKVPDNRETDYEYLAQHRPLLLKMAYNRFVREASPEMKNDFAVFVEQNRHWLRDYCLYLAIKNVSNDRPWYAWEPLLKKREPESLARFEKKHRKTLEFHSWVQFIFFGQWRRLRAYCHRKGVQLAGDIAFYVSHDSADVWANQSLFSIHPDGSMHLSGGVPPDLFSDTGQQWRMPVYNWEELRRQHYAWWISRLQHQASLFDRLRLDHFRAFHRFWQVTEGTPGQEIEGAWAKGPGDAFFEALQKTLGDFPFIAEDLGLLDDEVTALRDRWEFPGMRVLQFAFGTQLPFSEHTPHNYPERVVAYTGTHDNNTTRGWFTDLPAATARQVAEYLGREVNAETVSELFSQLLYQSTARTVVIPFQDLLNKDGHSRMNTPGTVTSGWKWRIGRQELEPGLARRLRKWTSLYYRD